MRHVILLDTKITDAEYNAWVKEDIAFWKKYIGMTPEYTMVRTDYRVYPTFVDSDGDIRPTNSYLKSLNDQVVAKFGEFAFDFVMVMIHEDNWKSDNDQIKGIWGTNYSYVFGKQCLDYCRWDRDNPANTFGTAYHERHHSFDAIIKQETGVTIEPELDIMFGYYDRCITHGKCPPWKYIQHKENVESLIVMAPHLRKAFSLREQRHKENIDSMKKKIVMLMVQLIYILRMKLNAKEGVPRM